MSAGRRRRGTKPSTQPPLTAPPPPPPREPVFWFGFAIPWAKLAAARVLFFSLLAVDAVLAIRHSPGYGAGAFNVAQLPGLDALGPTRPLHALAELVCAYLFVLIACNVATRFALPVATALYGWLYFGSQLDAYQHHYLITLILIVACAVPWRAPEGVTPATPIASWAIRLLLVQLAIVYLWAAIAKLSPAWLDGTTLSTQLTGGVRAWVDATLGVRATAWVIVGIEVSLAATVWWRRAWPLAATLGIGLHLAIILTGLELGLFPWLMLALYILILPDGVVLALLGWTRGGWRRVIADKLAGSGRWFVLVAAVVLGDALAAASQLEHALAVASTLVIVPITVVVGRAAGGRLPRVAWVGFAHLLALGTWVAVARAGHVAVDYHRRWGDDARRLGDAASAERAYGKLIELDPEEPAGHYQLGRLLLARGEAARGLAELREAQRLEPARARAYVEEARYLAGHGEAAAALAKAREATWAEDTSVEARALRDALTAGAAAPKPTGGGDAEADAP